MTVKDENGQSRKSDHDEGETGESLVRGPLCGVRGMITVRGYEGSRVGVLGLGRSGLAAALGLFFAVASAQYTLACTFASPAPIETTLIEAPTVIEGRVEGASYSYPAIIQSRGGGGLIDVSTLRTFKGDERERWQVEIAYQNWPVGDGTAPVWEVGDDYIFPIHEDYSPRVVDGDWFGKVAEYVFPPLPAVLVPACNDFPVFAANMKNRSIAKRLAQ